MENFARRLSQGSFSFNSAGKPMIVKRLNTANLPGLQFEANIGVDGVKIKKPLEEPEIISSSHSRNSAKRKGSTAALRLSEDYSSRTEMSKVVRVRPVTSTQKAKKQTIKKALSSYVEKNMA